MTSNPPEDPRDWDRPGFDERQPPPPAPGQQPSAAQRPGYPPVGQPGSAHGYPPNNEEKTWAWVSHAGTLVAAWLAMGFLCPLIIMFVKKDQPFVRRHAVESLNFQLSLLVYLLVSVILVFVLIGVFLLIALGVFALVTIILATVRAAAGEDYRYPLCIRLVT